MPVASAAAVARRAERLGLEVGWYATASVTASAVGQGVRREALISGDEIIIDREPMNREAPYKLLCIAPEPTAHHVLGELAASLPADCSAHRSSAGYLNVHLGDEVFVNYGLSMLDMAPISIGDGSQVGPCCQIYAVTHPLEAGPRAAGWEQGAPVSIGRNVWLGGGVVVCPGVSIGDDAVIGAGSVVVRDVPAAHLAVGNPSRVVRRLDP
jgi:acetyltransferase-like isoleucine patch superfamily enzyme